MIDRVLNAAQCIGSGDVSGHTDHEQVADALVEEYGWWNAGIRAGQDDCEWFLAA